jgi:hypothetical protein
MKFWVVHFIDHSVVPGEPSTLGTDEGNGAQVYIHVFAVGIANVHEVDVVTADATKYSRHWGLHGHKCPAPKGRALA